MALLELEGVKRSFRSELEEVRAVDGVSLSVRGGEMLALHGPSGSGKTTLLLLVAGLLSPDEGNIRFDGRDLRTLSAGQIADYLHHDVGFVYQSLQLMPQVPAIENASMQLIVGGMSMTDARRRALPWLERVGLAGRLRHTPEQLSAGERQRVAIARALAGEPRLILADEPTGNLDSARSIEAIELLREVARERGAAVLLVTHDLDAARVADRHCTLRDGRLLEAVRGGVRDRPPGDTRARADDPPGAAPTSAAAQG